MAFAPHTTGTWGRRRQPESMRCCLSRSRNWQRISCWKKRRPWLPLVETGAAALALTEPTRLDMLELRPNCECCDKDLPPESTEALICTFECTFCAVCNGQSLHGSCPNCGGNLVARPVRPARLLEKYPASTVRTVKPGGCAQAAAS
jgi:uncharacterized protein